MFNYGSFISHSGLNLDWKIDCDHLTLRDLDCLARAYIDKYGNHFYTVLGVPTGGLRFAKRLNKYKDINALDVLVVDDVLTTGKSMIKYMNMIAKYNTSPIKCLVIFDRSNGDNLPDNTVSLFGVNV